MPYPVKHPANLALQIVEFVAIFALVYGVCFVIFPVVYGVLVDTATAMVQLSLRHL